MRLLALLVVAHLAFSAFVVWLSYQPLPLTIVIIDPAEQARWRACQALYDPWLD